MTRLHQLVIGFTTLWVVGLGAGWGEWALFMVGVIAWFAFWQVPLRSQP